MNFDEHGEILRRRMAAALEALESEAGEWREAGLAAIEILRGERPVGERPFVSREEYDALLAENEALRRAPDGVADDTDPYTVVHEERGGGWTSQMLVSKKGRLATRLWRDGSEPIDV